MTILLLLSFGAVVYVPVLRVHEAALTTRVGFGFIHHPEVHILETKNMLLIFPLCDSGMYAQLLPLASRITTPNTHTRWI